MTSFPDYHKYDGLGLVGLVAAKQVTPAELIEEAITRIERHNPRLNAVVYKMYDQARSAVQGPLPEGPFRGVPFLIKDLISMVQGVPTSCGNRLLRDIPAPYDSEMVRRLKRSGVILLGKTNTPEFGLTPYTEPEVLGATRNPWDPDRTPGGSSGGSAAAVASGMVPIAGGGDGGGSIRIPASCCGLFGLKPTRGRTPTGPEIGESWRGFTIEHVITRSVRDSAAMLDAVAGADVGAPYLAPPQERPYLSEVGEAPARLRIAFTSHPFLGQRVHEDCVKGLESTVRLLQQLGHEVIEDAPMIHGEEFAVDFLTILLGETRADIEWAAGLAKRRPNFSDFEAATYAMGLLGRATRASDYAIAARRLQTAGREIGRFFEKRDVLLTPTLSQPPVPIGAFSPSAAERALMTVVGRLNAGWLLSALGVVKSMAAQVFEFIPYTPPFNVTGQPAMSVPLCWSEAGLPIGMHFVGKFGDEATLFRLAGQLEKAQPWFDRVPSSIVV